MVHLYYATNTKKLQGTQTQETQSDARHRVWKKIKSHGTQTRPVSSRARSGAWKKIKLHDTQTIDYHGKNALEKSKLHDTQTPYQFEARFKRR